jgi:hypothetical protein
LEIDKLVVEKSYTNSVQKSILSAACRNSDIRILKYIIENFHVYHRPEWNNVKFVTVLFSQIFSPHIPEKYQLRRMKLINQKINLIPYYGEMINFMVHSIDFFVTLSKYYNKDFTLTNQHVLCITNMIWDDSSEIEKIKLFKVLDVLKTDSKLLVIISLFPKCRSLHDIDLSEYVSECSEDCLKTIESLYIPKLVDAIIDSRLPHGDNYISWNVKDLKAIFNIWEPIFHQRYLTQTAKYLKPLLYILPFVNYFDSKNKQHYNFIAKLNFIKLKIKILIRKNHKVISLKNKIKLFNETKDLTSDVVKHKFTKVPPRHILPFELQALKEKSDGLYLIKEKADGCLVDFISKDVEPIIPEYFSNTIKAEFIEDLDLYLIFDINLDNTGLIERYDYLRKLHPSTSDSLIGDNPIIESFDMLKQEIAKERADSKLSMIGLSPIRESDVEGCNFLK